MRTNNASREVFPQSLALVRFPCVSIVFQLISYANYAFGLDLNANYAYGLDLNENYAFGFNSQNEYMRLD